MHLVFDLELFLLRDMPRRRLREPEVIATGEEEASGDEVCGSFLHIDLCLPPVVLQYLNLFTPELKKYILPTF